MIKLKNIEKVYTHKGVAVKALDGINLEINAGESICIFGPSGSGKSTLLNIIGLLAAPGSGFYYFNDQEVSAMPEKTRSTVRKENISFVFEEFDLIDELTVAENVELPLVYRRWPSALRKKKVENALERVNMSHKRHDFPRRLSGEQLQRTAIARAYASEPAVVIADEPTGSLDSTSGENIMKLLARLNEEGTTLILGSHSANAAAYARRIVNLFDGKIVTINMTEQFKI